jgi:hypothetical protein
LKYKTAGVTLDHEIKKNVLSPFDDKNGHRLRLCFCLFFVHHLRREGGCPGVGALAVFYQISEENPSTIGYSFTSHQVGFQIGYRY